MGLDRNAVRFLLNAQTAGVNFDSTLTLGRQWLILDDKEAQQELSRVSPQWQSLLTPGGFADEFLKAIGASDLQVMDVSDYEQAQILHDLNNPIPDWLKNKFDVVIDGGTCEHVFNYPCAIKNCMEMVRVGGALFTFPPANNHCGHGFYQISPEAHFRILCEENGFHVDQIILFEWGRDQWYEVIDPERVRSRVELRSGSRPVVMMTRATKIADQPIFEKWPQQSDYVTAWAGSGPSKPNAYSRYVPNFLKPIARKVYFKYLKRQWTLADHRCYRPISSN